MSYSIMESQIATFHTEVEYQSLEQQFEQAVEQQDLESRARCNRKITHADYRLYMSLISTYPQLLTGKPTSIRVWEVRENAGWVSEASASQFFQTMVTIGAFAYDPGKFSRDEQQRQGLVTADLKIFPYPEAFDMRSTESRKKKRESEKEKRDVMRLALLILQCENCGSSEIRYDLLPTCKECGHKHAPLTGIDASRLTIAPEKADAAGDMPGLDDFMHKEPASPAASFNDYSLDSYAGGCANWNKHRAKWKQYKSGLHCPECEPAYK